MAVFLSPVGGAAVQFFDNSGNVLTGGKLYTYLAGTTTPTPTYTSNTGVTFHTNPIILDAAGRVPAGGEIWLADGIQYKFVLKDANEVLIGTYDNIIGINSNFLNYEVQQEIVTATAGQTVFNLTTITYQPGTNTLTVFVDGVNQYGPGAQYAYIETDSDTVTFVNGLHVGALVKFSTAVTLSAGVTTAALVTFNGFDNQVGVVQDLADDDGSDWIGFIADSVDAVARSAQNKMRDVVSVKDFGAVGDGVVDDTIAIQNAIDYAYDSGIGNVYFPSATYKITKSLLVWGAEPSPYFSKSVSLTGQDNTNTIILKTTNNGYGGVSPYATDDAIFVLARRDLTAGNLATLGSIIIKNFYLKGDFGTGKVAFGIFNRCSLGNCIFSDLSVEAAIGFQTITDMYLSTITNANFVVSTKGFSMLASGTSNLLSNVYVFGATSIGYELQGAYSSANSIAADACTGVCYNFNFGNWLINGLGSESENATTVIFAANSNVIINNPFIFPQDDAGAKVFDISSNIVTVNGGYIGGGAGIPTARLGQLANVSAVGTFELNNTSVIDTYAVPNSNRFTRSAGASKSGLVNVPSGVPTALRTLENNQVGIFIAYATSNAGVFSTSYAGAANVPGIFTLSNNQLTLTLVGSVVTATQSTGSALDIAYQYLVFGEQLLP